ncbi:MAG: alpha/beta hydrolase family protein [Thermoproteota archaeon]
MKAHEKEYEEARQKIDYTIVSRKEKEGMILNFFKIMGYDEDIPGFLAYNKAGPSGKMLLFIHGLGGRKEDVLFFENFMKTFDFSIMAIDARGHGERKIDLVTVQSELMLEYLNKTVVDNRLAIDIAFRGDWVEEGKLILAGVSMGGILGGVIAGVDDRVSGAVLYVPGGDLMGIISNSKVEMLVEIRRRIPSFALSLIKPMLASVDPINYIDRISPRPLLIQLGKYDDIVPFENGMKLFEKAKEPKKLVVHDSGHALPLENAIEETINWMRVNFPSLIT